MRCIFYFCLTCLVLTVNAQESSTSSPDVKTTYFNGFFEREEARKDAAEYVEIVKTGADSLRTVEIRNILLDQIVLEAFFKDKQPTGIWYYHLATGAKVLNYNFELDYGIAAPDSTERERYLPAGLKIGNPMVSDQCLQYTAPRLATGHKSFNEFLQENLVYPYPAMVRQDKGKVQMGVLIDEEGRVSNIKVEGGVNPILDKEAMRIMRKLLFSNGATYKGKPVAIYYQLGITFYFE